MRLDFNVLWVDDQPDHVDAQVKRIAVRMQDHGFKFNPTLCRSLDRVRELIRDDVFTDEVDLILVDWDLGRRVEGQTAIAAIRERIVYKDVVFYSAITEAAKLRQLAFDGQLEGVYCVTRQDLVEEVIGVFESLVKKVLDLDHTRGIVMGATSDIDQTVLDCLLQAHEGADEPGKAALLADAVKRVKRKGREHEKAILKLLEGCAFRDILDAHAIFTANDRLRMLSRVLAGESMKAHHHYRTSVEEYLEEVVPGRNILGHQVLNPQGKPVAVVNNKGQQISLDETRSLRRRLLELRAQFRALLQALEGRT